MSNKIKYLRSLPYLLVIFLGVMWWLSNNSADYEKSQREFWTRQYEEVRKNHESLQEKYNRNLKELRERETVVVEVTERPDGTIVRREERTEERTETRDTTERELAREDIEETVLKEDLSGSVEIDERRSARSVYSVHLAHPVAASFDFERARFDVGARLGRSPFSLTVGSDGQFSNVYFGLRFDF